MSAHECNCPYCDGFPSQGAQFKGGFYRAAEMVGAEKDMLELLSKCDTREELIHWWGMYAPLVAGYTE